MNLRKIQPNPEEIFKTFRHNVAQDIKRNNEINYKAFSCRLNDISDTFEMQNKRKDLNRVAMRFAEMLVGLGNNNLAGIVYSFLIKLNQENAKLVEELATKALAIAKRQHDPIHTMARANDLKRIYKITEPGSDKHLKALYTAKRALFDICTNYDNVQKRYQSVRTKMKPVKQYEIMLASLGVEIGKVLRLNNPKMAEQELLSARQIFAKLNHNDRVEEIDKILKNLND